MTTLLVIALGLFVLAAVVVTVAYHAAPDLPYGDDSEW